jgi:hypothetical protein
MLDKIPEIWYPGTGEIRQAPIYLAKDGRIEMPIFLPPLGSVFVVFRESPDQKHITNIKFYNQELFPAQKQESINLSIMELLQKNENELVVYAMIPGTYRFSDNSKRTYKIKVKQHPKIIPVTDFWQLSFPKGWGAPDSVIFDKLISLTESDDPGIKFFSGTVTYSNTFIIDKADFSKSNTFLLELGNVKDVAEIVLNGKFIRILWAPPFKVNVTSVLVPGTNKLTIRVTNLWPNRLIGDQFLPEKERYTFTNIKKFTKDSPLRESGLLGPVCILKVKRKSFKF